MSSKGNILVVDDTPLNLRLLTNMLGKQRYTVRPVPNGKLAISGAQAIPPDLILLDIMMPEMDGYEVCQALKADDRTKDIPVIFISALNEVMDKVKAFSVGGVDYITKPFQFEEVLARVQTHLTIRKLQQQLEAANTNLETLNDSLTVSNQELDAFARTVAHDLKNPLGAIRGYVELLQEEVDMLDNPNEMMGDLVMYVGRAAQKSISIIEELLLLAGVRKGEVERAPVLMTAVIDDVLLRLDSMIKEYEADIIHPESWLVPMGYAPWLEEVWANYISNAMKYGGQPPQVELGSTRLDNDTLKFWVKDNGKGLSEEERAKLFTEFTRLDEVRAKGHGLGLSIVRRIVEKLGGTVGVESTLGEGSVFYFTMPDAENRSNSTN